jgi:hypothetical protein
MKIVSASFLLAYFFLNNETKPQNIAVSSACVCSQISYEMATEYGHSGWGIGNRDSISSRGKKLFSSQSQNCPSGPPIFLPLWSGAIFHGGKTGDACVDYSPPSSAQFRNKWSYASPSPYTAMTWCLIKQRDKFISINLTSYHENWYCSM